jgi:hypothetical protein
MRRFYLLAAALMMGVAAPRAAAACDCVQSTTCQGVLRSSAVFVGRVVGIKDATVPARPPATLEVFGGRLVTFRVVERFFGVTESDVTVRTGMGGGDCGYGFVVGTTYLVYAYTLADGSLTTSICSRTQPSSSAGADLKYLRGLTTPPAVEARAFGRATSAGKPFAGARVIAESGDHVITAVTDADGKFELHGPPGVYRLGVEVPSGKSAVAPARVSLFDSRGCGTIAVSVQVAKLR